MPTATDCTASFTRQLLHVDAPQEAQRVDVKLAKVTGVLQPWRCNERLYPTIHAIAIFASGWFPPPPSTFWYSAATR